MIQASTASASELASSSGAGEGAGATSAPKPLSQKLVEELAVQLESLLDRHAEDSETVRANYRRAMELELGFFAANV